MPKFAHTQISIQIFKFLKNWGCTQLSLWIQWWSIINCYHQIGKELIQGLYAKNVYLPHSQLIWHFVTQLYDKKLHCKTSLGEFTIMSQPIRLSLVDWFVFQFLLDHLPFFSFFWCRLPFFLDVVILVFQKKY